ncbi:hypothetical protein N7524_001067 [Penicillium chrysogenum]|nr:hypothetical protein N7524_001067 [Penicillium chrysogenum]
MYVTSTRIASTCVDGANAFICTEYDFNLISGVCPPPDTPKRKAPARDAPYPIGTTPQLFYVGLISVEATHRITSN